MKNYNLLIDQYLNNELQGEDLNEFNRLRETNSGLRKDIALHQDLDKYLSDFDAMSLSLTLSEIMGDKNEAKVVDFFKKNLLKVAAAIAILFTVAGGYILHSSSSSKGIYNNYFNYEIPSFQTRSLGSTKEANLDYGIYFLENKEFDKAISILEKIDNNSLATLYTGIAYMEKENFSDAMTKFQKIIDHKESIVIDQALWYKALSLLKVKKENDAINCFKQIEKQNSSFSFQAKKILERLN
ncbi:MAG: tol-pal system YbgF family protein [Hyphomicrobiales bacterium]